MTNEATGAAEIAATEPKHGCYNATNEATEVVCASVKSRKVGATAPTAATGSIEG